MVAHDFRVGWTWQLMKVDTAAQIYQQNLLFNYHACNSTYINNNNNILL